MEDMGGSPGVIGGGAVIGPPVDGPPITGPAVRGPVLSDRSDRGVEEESLYSSRGLNFW